MCGAGIYHQDLLQGAGGSDGGVAKVDVAGQDGNVGYFGGGLVDSGDKGVACPSGQRGLKRPTPNGGEVGGSCAAGDIGLAVGVQGNALAVVGAIATKKRGVGQSAGRRVQLGDESILAGSRSTQSVVAESQDGLDGTRCGEVRRIGEAGNEGSSGGGDGDSVGLIGAGATEKR